MLLSAGSASCRCRYTLVDEATEDNGCLWVLPRSHLHGVLKGEQLAAVLNQGTAVPVTGRPGDCLLFRCATNCVPLPVISPGHFSRSFLYTTLTSVLLKFERLGSIILSTHRHH